MKKLCHICICAFLLYGSISRSEIADGNFYSIIYNSTKSNIYSCGFSKRDSDFIDVWTVVRYNSDGSIDSTFGNDGYIVEAALGRSMACSITVDTANNSYVGGWTLVNDVRVWTVIKYTNTGARDTTFNGTGMVQETALGVGEAYSVSLSRTLIPQVIYVTGFTNISNKPVMTVISYNQDGTHNTSFNP